MGAGTGLSPHPWPGVFGWLRLCTLASCCPSKVTRLPMCVGGGPGMVTQPWLTVTHSETQEQEGAGFLVLLCRSR